MMSKVEERGKVHALTDSHIVPLDDVKIEANSGLGSSRQGDIKVYINIVPSEVNRRKRRAVKEEFEIDWSSFHFEYIFNKRGALYFIEGLFSTVLIIIAALHSRLYELKALVIVFASLSLVYCLVNIIYNVFFLDFGAKHYVTAKMLELSANPLIVAFHVTNFIIGVCTDGGVAVAIFSIILTMLFLVSTFFSLEDAGCCKELSTGEPSKAKRKLAVKRKKRSNTAALANGSRKNDCIIVDESLTVY